MFFLINVMPLTLKFEAESGHPWISGDIPAVWETVLFNNLHQVQRTPESLRDDNCLHIAHFSLGSQAEQL